MMGKTKRPVSELVDEKLLWLEKQCKNRNTEQVSANLDDIEAANKAFAHAMTALNILQAYLLGAQVAPAPPDDSDE
jgi:hypothetical protein